MDLDIFGERVWVPEEDTPCINYPDAWADNTVYNEKETRELAKKMCRVDCYFVEECFISSMNQERGLTLDERKLNGIRGGCTPKERHSLEKSRSNQVGNDKLNTSTPIPTAMQSEEDMQKDIPAARRVLEAHEAMDLAEMIGVD